MNRKYVLYVNVSGLTGTDAEKYLQNILNRFKDENNPWLEGDEKIALIPIKIGETRLETVSY